MSGVISILQGIHAVDAWLVGLSLLLVAAALSRLRRGSEGARSR
jgi:hypothetical protein